jgi:hypothetical protein
MLDPFIVQFWTVLFVASFMNWIVLAPAAADVFSIVSPFPPLFSPSINTLSAPFRLITGPPAIVPLTVHIPPDGDIVSDVHELTEGWFRAAEAASVVLAMILIEMVFPACVPFRLRASNAAFTVT